MTLVNTAYLNSGYLLTVQDVCSRVVKHYGSNILHCHCKMNLLSDYNDRCIVNIKT